MTREERIERLKTVAAAAYEQRKSQPDDCLAARWRAVAAAVDAEVEGWGFCEGIGRGRLLIVEGWEK